MKNVKAISTTIGLLVMTTAANAQFTARQSMPDYINKECMVAKVTPPDHDRDPGYKVNVSADFENGKISGFDAVHTTMSGTEYSRSRQYTNATLESSRNWVQWIGWRHDYRMVGTLYLNNGRWRYDEQVFRNGRVQTTINTICHDEPE
jgi:hypothetical protein